MGWEVNGGDGIGDSGEWESTGGMGCECGRPLLWLLCIVPTQSCLSPSHWLHELQLFFHEHLVSHVCLLLAHQDRHFPSATTNTVLRRLCGCFANWAILVVFNTRRICNSCTCNQKQSDYNQGCVQDYKTIEIYYL